MFISCSDLVLKAFEGNIINGAKIGFEFFLIKNWGVGQIIKPSYEIIINLNLKKIKIKDIAVIH
jgi:hypothetical protein